MGSTLKVLALACLLSAGCRTQGQSQVPSHPAPIRARGPAPVAPTPFSEPAPAPRATAIAPPAPPPICPTGMVLLRRLQGPYCIDRYEASLERVKPDGTVTRHPFNENVDGLEKEIRAVSVKGVRPQGYISGVQAAAACQNAGKRLCEIDEWVLACRGPKGTKYPYGDERKPNVCNDRFRVLDHHPVPILWKKDPLDRTNDKLMWHPKFMNDPRLLELPNTTTPTGAFEKCTNEYGAFDMVGNQHEWVNDPEGTFFGGFFMDTFQNGEGCEYRTKGHPFDYHDYSTGFRCCADPRSTE
jgi:hypothetical protein